LRGDNYVDAAAARDRLIGWDVVTPMMWLQLHYAERLATYGRGVEALSGTFTSMTSKLFGDDFRAR